jgi:hypothetical protein
MQLQFNIFSRKSTSFTLAWEVSFSRETEGIAINVLTKQFIFI